MKSKALKNTRVIELLKKHSLDEYMKKYDKVKEHPEDDVIFPFVKELLGEKLSEKVINDLYYGINDNGINSSYGYYIITEAAELYVKLQNPNSLYEIGFKRCERKEILSVLEKYLERKMKKIGTCLVYSSTYDLYEDKETGILLSLYTQWEDRWGVTDKNGEVKGLIISSSSYSGIILPDFNRCYELAKLFNKELKNNEIEWPTNGLGAVSIRDMFKENVTPEQAENNKKLRNANPKLPYELEYPFLWQSDVQPVVKGIAMKLRKQKAL